MWKCLFTFLASFFLWESVFYRCTLQITSLLQCMEKQEQHFPWMSTEPETLVKQITRVSVSFSVVNQMRPWIYCRWLPSAALLTHIKLGLFLAELGVILLSNVLWGKNKAFSCRFIVHNSRCEPCFPEIVQWMEVVGCCSVCTQGKSDHGDRWWSQLVCPLF